MTGNDAKGGLGRETGEKAREKGKSQDGWLQDEERQSGEGHGEGSWTGKERVQTEGTVDESGAAARNSGEALRSDR